MSLLCSYDDTDLNIWLDSRINPCGKSCDRHLWNRKHNIMHVSTNPKQPFLMAVWKKSFIGPALLSGKLWRSLLEELSLEKMQMQCSARGVRNTMTQIHCKCNCCRFCGWQWEKKKKSCFFFLKKSVLKSFASAPSAYWAVSLAQKSESGAWISGEKVLMHDNAGTCHPEWVNVVTKQQCFS